MKLSSLNRLLPPKLTNITGLPTGGFFKNRFYSINFQG
jgi:hypothetical protein